MSETEDIKTTTPIESDSVDFPEDGSTVTSAPALDDQPVDSEAVIVYDKDEEGNVIGWHKEAPTEETE